MRPWPLLAPALLLPAAPAAAAPWSAPAPLLRPATTDLIPLAIRPFADGSRLVLSEQIERNGRCSTDEVVGVTPLAADGTARATVRRGGRLLAGPLPLPGGRTAVVLTVPAGRRCLERGVVLTLDGSGRTVAVRRLEVRVGDAELSLGPGGGLSVVYVTYEPARGSVSVERVREVVGAGRPRTLMRLPNSRYFDGGLGDLTVAGTGVGARVLAFTRSNCAPTRGTDDCALNLDVQAATARPGKGFGRLRRVGRLSGDFSRLVATVTTRGRAIVAWGSQDGGEEAGQPWLVEAASTDARGRWRRAAAVDPGDLAERPSGYLALRPTPAGGATLAWSGITRDGTPLRVADARDGVFGRPQDVLGDGAVQDLRIAPDGTTTLLSRGEGPLVAVRRAPGGPFAPPETVTDGPANSPLLGPAGDEVLTQGPGLTRLTRSPAP